SVLGNRGVGTCGTALHPPFVVCTASLAEELPQRIRNPKHLPPFSWLTFHSPLRPYSMLMTRRWIQPKPLPLLPGRVEPSYYR
uniref:Uncharacterized protein n=1 Tax=Oncorhynchus tshawytscha TaxID=74940 RepID=A0A8C8D904_ONCTS